MPPAPRRIAPLCSSPAQSGVVEDPELLAVRVPAPVTRPGPAPGACFAGRRFPWFPSLANRNSVATAVDQPIDLIEGRRRFQFGPRTPPDLAGFVPQIVSAGKTTPPGG